MIVGIRPEALRPVPAAAETGVVSATVAFVEDLGATLLIHLDAGDAQMVHASVVDDDEDIKAIRPRLRAMVDGGLSIRAGDMMHFAVDPAAIHVFDAASGAAL